MLGKLTKNILTRAQYSQKKFISKVISKSSSSFAFNKLERISPYLSIMRSFEKNCAMKIQKRNFSDASEKIVNEEETNTYQETNKEQLGFKAETKKLLDIVTHSLYTDKEIFLRELLSNCSDALEKQRFFEVTGKLESTGEPLFISVNTNEKNRTVTIFDSGIGMTRQEIIDNLGTIAKSGTQSFVKTLKEQQKEGFSNESLIGQFGVVWYREKKDISAEEYQKFFELLSGNSKNAYKYLLHFSSDVPLDIKALLYIPAVSMEKFGMSDESTGLSLYSKKVLIKPKCQELLPNYFRFVKGVVDCADIPLALSRESYQDSSLIYRLKVLITKRIIKKLEEEINKDPESYNNWYEEFQQYLREGIMTDQDNQKNLFKLLRFKGTFSTHKKIGIDDYLKNMRDGQNKIYYIIIPNDGDIESNIFLENYKGSNLPILITNTPLDDMILRQIGDFNNFKFLNIENETDDFLTNFKTESGSVVNKLPDDDITPYTLWIKNELEPYVTKVSISKRLKDSPILITSAISTHMKTFMAMMSQGKEGSVIYFFLILFFRILFLI